MAHLIDEVRRVLEDANYIAAGMMIRESDDVDSLRFEALGLAVESAVTALETEKNKERIVYLRTMLSWLFREVPGLSYLYREQLRLVYGRQSGWQDLSNVAKFFRDLGAETPGAETVEDGADKAKEFADRLKEKSADVQEQVKDFFAQSGIDLDEGLKRAGDFFDNLSGRKPKKDEPRDVNEE